MSDSENLEKSGCLIFFIWCLPILVVPLVTVMLGDAIPVGLILSFFIVLWIGFAWAKSTFPPEERISVSDRKRIRLKALRFTLAQCVIVPLFYIIVFYGFCGITGQGRI